MKCHHDLVVKTSADSDYSLSKYTVRLRSRKHTHMVSAKLHTMLGQVTHSKHGRPAGEAAGEEAAGGGSPGAHWPHSRSADSYRASKGEEVRALDSRTHWAHFPVGELQ